MTGRQQHQAMSIVRYGCNRARKVVHFHYFVRSETLELQGRSAIKRKIGENRQKVEQNKALLHLINNIVESDPEI